MAVEPKLVAERQRNLVLVEFHTVDDGKVVLLDLTQLSHEEKVVQLVRHGRIHVSTNVMTIKETSFKLIGYLLQFCTHDLSLSLSVHYRVFQNRLGIDTLWRQPQRQKLVTIRGVHVIRQTALGQVVVVVVQGAEVVIQNVAILAVRGTLLKIRHGPLRELLLMSQPQYIHLAEWMKITNRPLSLKNEEQQ